MSEATTIEPFVSVVVCTRNRPNDLKRCLPSILSNTYANFELIVVDQSASDDGERIVRGLHDRRASLIQQRCTGKSRALNVALARARGDVIALTDDDCTVTPRWLHRATAVLAEDPTAGIVFGALIAAPHDEQRTYIPTFLPPRYLRITSPVVRAHLGLGANMVVQRRVFERVGSFAQWIGPGARFRSGDDIELTYRALRAGFAAVIDPQSVVVHWGERPYRSGDAGRLVANNFYGIGALYGRHARRGDWVAVGLLCRELAVQGAHAAGRTVRLQRHLGLRRLAYFVWGAIDALRSPSDDVPSDDVAEAFAFAASRGRPEPAGGLSEAWKGLGASSGGTFARLASAQPDQLAAGRHT